MVADMDNYSPIPMVMKILQDLLHCYETWSIFQPFKNFVRAKGLKFAFEYMAAEDLQTNFIDIGPVNKVLNLVSAFCGKIWKQYYRSWDAPRTIHLFPSHQTLPLYTVLKSNFIIY